MIKLPKASEAKVFFDGITEKIRDKKICAVFSKCPSFNTFEDRRTYSEDTPIYIMFDDGQCLIIEYRFADELCVDFRTLTADEKSFFDTLLIKDFFNCTINIHEAVSGICSKNWPIIRTEICVLEYDSVSSIELRTVTEEYPKWINHNIKTVSPTKETFDEIRFIMSNGNTFCLCPERADTDGYVMVWSNEAKEEIIYYK